MGNLKNFVTPLHKQSKRNYIERMNNDKINCSSVAKNYSKDYWMEIENMVMVVINTYQEDGKR